jgi:transcriptional regulator with XRE-family HTH domain
MKISAQSTDSAVLEELGSRLRDLRLQRNLSQAGLAAEAGIGRVTLQRIEEGGTNASLSSLIRILRALDLAEGLDQLVPEATPSPIAELQRRGSRPRERAGARRDTGRRAQAEGPWRWGDEGAGSQR